MESLRLELEISKKEFSLKLEQQTAQEKISLERERLEIESLKQALQSEYHKYDEQKSLIHTKLEDLSEKQSLLEKGNENINKLSRMYRQRIQKIASFSEEEAKEELKEDVQRNAGEWLQDYRNQLLRKGESKVKEEASRILITAMQRLAHNSITDVTATTVTLESEDMKGRIIGREGRNIRAFEGITGTTLMIDETPQSVLISSFDPVRREIARLALEQLVKDGRIHPASIEDRVEQAKNEVEQSIHEYGESAAERLGIRGLPTEILHYVGTLHFRLSNNQNTLEHSVEVAKLCALIAEELGLDAAIARRCGLFHDLGKVLNEDFGGSHSNAAANLLRRYDENPEVVNAVEASHEEVEATSLYAALLQVADALSSTRPGVRGDTMDGYIKRVESLEAIAKNQMGVTEAFALHAGRELRVIVNAEKMDDLEARKLSRHLRMRIEEELTYPTPIKVTVVREQRFIETAK